jgi:hypothetical protein
MRTKKILKIMRVSIEGVDKELLNARAAYLKLSRADVKSPAATILERLVHQTASDMGIFSECLSVLEGRLK